MDGRVTRSEASTEIVLLNIVIPCRLFAPAGDVHKVCHEARDDAFQDGGVAEDDVLLIHVRLVLLPNDYTWAVSEWGSVIFFSICSGLLQY